MPRQLWPGPVLLGAILLAGCGGSSGAGSGASGGAGKEAVVSTSYRTPQSAVRGYVNGLESRNGSLLCGTLASSLRRAVMSYTVRAGLAEAGVSCAEALDEFAKAETKGKRRFRLPRLHVAMRGERAIVGYIGPRTHKRRTFALVKGKSGWLIARIDGEG
jgi:hypothetical protein